MFTMISRRTCDVTSWSHVWELRFSSLDQGMTGGLPEPCVPRQAQAQRLRYDEELNDLGVPDLRHGT
jgi:hypothetical protein